MPKILLFVIMGSLYQAIGDGSRSLLLGGEPISDVEFPFMVKLEDEHGIHKCGGTLITYDTVLTAAHCLNSVAKVETRPKRMYRIKKAFKHPRYSDRDYSTGGGVSVDPFDIGIIILENTADQESTNLVRLNSDLLLPQNFADLTAVGWNTSAISEQLYTAAYMYMPNSACIESWGQYSNQTIFYRDRLIDASFCSVPTQKRSSVCSGDAGAPLLLMSDSSPLQVSTVAGPIDCGSPALALLSVRISSTYPWIQLMVCQNSGNIPASYSCDNITTEASTGTIPASMVATSTPATTNKSKAFGRTAIFAFIPLIFCILAALRSIG